VSSNPVLGQSPWRQDAAASPYQGQYAQQGQYGQQYAPERYGAPVAPVTDRMTIDDVVMKTLSLLGVVLVTGAVAWKMIPPVIAPVVLFAALGIGLVLGLIISLKQVTNPVAILAYAAAEGVLLGQISSYYEARFPGIVISAVIGTFGVFAGMAALYRFRVIRATPKFTKWLFGAVIGVGVLMLANFLLQFAGVDLGLRDGGPLAIAFSLVCIGVAALTFIQDFAIVEEGVAQGAPRRFGWYAGFAILVSLVWLYLEILRLLSYLRR
jgi:uncharacterized YccA/Bax inhibitor family protein